MNGAGLVLAAILAIDGGTDIPRAEPDAAGVRRGRLELDDGSMLEVDGGAWLSDALLFARSRDLQRLSAENRELKAAPPPQVATPAAVVIGFVAGAVIGGAGAAYGTFKLCQSTAVCR